MKVEILACENFLALGKLNLNLEDQGLVLIQGQNLTDASANSNGSGKSSIPDLLSWVLFGVTARGVSGDDVINDQAGKNCWGAVRLKESESVAYRIARFRKDKSHGNVVLLERIDGTTCTDISGGTTKLTQEKINKIIGCSYEVFKSAIYAAQEQMPDLPNLTDGELKKLIEESAGIDRLQAAYEIAKKRRLTASTYLANLKTTMEGKLNAYELAKENAIKIEEDMHGWEMTREIDLETLDQKVRDHRVVVSALRDEIGSKYGGMWIAGVEAYLGAVEKDLAIKNESLRGFAAENEKLREFEAAEKAAERKEAVASSELSAVTKRAKDLKAKFLQVEDQVGRPCDECGKIYERDDIAHAHDLADKALREKVRELKQAKADYEVAQERVSDARRATKSYRSSMTDVSAISAEISALQSAIKEATNALNKAKALDELSIRLGTQRNEKRKETNPLLKTLERAKTNVIEANDRLLDATAEHDAQRKEYDEISDAAEVFSPSGVRAHILDSVTPFLNERTAHYLGSLSDGAIEAVWSTLTEDKKGELKEKFTISVAKDKGAKSFKGLSGGEKKKVRLATAWALQDLQAARATKPWELFIADEIDDAVDESGLERLMSLLNEKAREKGTVLVISHNELGDWISNVTLVTNENGIATVSGAMVNGD